MGDHFPFVDLGASICANGLWRAPRASFIDIILPGFTIHQER